MKLPRRVCAALAAAILIAGCGASRAAENHVAGHRLTIYASLPFDGPSATAARALLGGIEVALDAAHHRVGRYRIVLRVLNDATPASRGWDPGQTSQNARAAAANPSTIGYLGDLDSGASAVSIPLLNRAEIPQISPASTAVGLTTGSSEAAPGEPEKYYPTQRRTFARVIPSDAGEATVQAQLQWRDGCRRVAVLDDGEVDGRDGAISFTVAARAMGLKLVDSDEFDPHAPGYAALATSVAQARPDCVLISGLTQNGAVQVTEQVARALPAARLYAWSGLAVPTYAERLPAALDERLRIVAPVADPDSADHRFMAAYARRYGAPPPGAVYGYESMSLMLDAIARATRGGRTRALRSGVLAAIFATRSRHSPLGTYSIDAHGDTTLDRYGVYSVRAGRLVLGRRLSG